MKKEDNELEEISGGAAVASQVFVLFFITPLFISITYLLIHTAVKYGISVGIVVFIAVVISVLFFIVNSSYKNADIYFSGEYIVIKKLFSTIKKPIISYKSIGESFLPNKYYIEFNNHKKVYFYLKMPDLLKRVTDTDVSQIISTRFEEKIRLLDLKR